MLVSGRHPTQAEPIRTVARCQTPARRRRLSSPVAGPNEAPSVPFFPGKQGPPWRMACRPLRFPPNMIREDCAMLKGLMMNRPLLVSGLIDYAAEVQAHFAGGGGAAAGEGRRVHDAG